MTDHRSGPAAMPAAEIDVDVQLVERLLHDQHPDPADRPLRVLANGWDNTMFRLGDDLTVRLPRRGAAARLVEHEQRFLPKLGPRLPLPVPAPVRIGRPTDFYPWSWSVLAWFDGEPAGAATDLDGPTVADQLGRFLAALHLPAPEHAPKNPFRGGPLAERDGVFRERVAGLGDLVDRATIIERWEASVDATPWSGQPLWLHGDLHSHNLVSSGGRLVAVIDFGDITSGDPATDLAAAWSVLDQCDHEAFRAAASSEDRPVDDAMWLRAEGWAIGLGLVILANSADSPAMETMARRIHGPLDID